MSLNESIVEAAALTWFGSWAMRSGTGRSSPPVNRRRSGIRLVRCLGIEVWIAEDPDHMIHFNRERFLELYPDVMPPPSRS